MTRQEIENLTLADVAAAKSKRGGKSTIDFVLSQVGTEDRTLEKAKSYLLSILEKKQREQT